MPPLAVHLMIGLGATAAAAMLAAAVLIARQKPIDDAFLGASTAAARVGGALLERRSAKSESPLVVWRPCPRGPELRVRPEDLADRAAERAGLESALELGDPEWSARFHVECDDAAFAAALLGEPARRQAVADLFALGFSEVHRDAGQVRAVWPHFTQAPKCDDPVQYGAEFGRRAADALSALAAHASSAAAPPPAELSGVNVPEASGLVSQTLFMGAASAVLGVSILALFLFIEFTAYLPFCPVDGWGAFMASLRVSLPAGGVALAAALGRVRGRTWFMSAARQAALAALVGAPVLGYGAYCLGNALLDGGPASVYEVPVTGRHSSHGSRTTSYYVELGFAHPGLDAWSMDVSYFDYARLTPGRSRLKLVTRPGRFGWEWMASRTFQP